MKISLEWLKCYVAFEEGAEELAHRFTAAGLTVETIERAGGDTVLDIEVTSNRPDCLGHIGIARELAVLLGEELKLPPAEPEESGKPVGQQTAVEVQCPELCPRYTARIIDDVKVAPSPDWLRRGLEAVGIRSVNNVVDVTNYVLMECAQPLHAFDYRKLKQGRIVVRRANKNESIVSIDGRKHSLTSDMPIIADAEVPVAVAGVMGGVDSEVDHQTRTVLLESAQFDPLSVRRTARTLSLFSESSYRFERGVDWRGVEWASRRAALLLARAAGGGVAPGLIDVAAESPAPIQTTLRIERLKHLLGIEVAPEKVLEILDRLGFEPKAKDNCVAVTVPTWRRDVTREVDLIEEIARVVGYDAIPVRDRIEIAPQPPAPAEKERQNIQAALNAAGFFEAITFSMLDKDRAGLLLDFSPEQFVHVQGTNNVLRPSLLPSLLTAKKANQDAGNARCDLYELATVFAWPKGKNKDLPEQVEKLGLVSDADFREVMGVLEDLTRGAALLCRPDNVPGLLPGENGKLVLDGQVVGVIGRVDPRVRDQLGLRASPVVAELAFEPLVKVGLTARPFVPLPRFPAIDRDLNVVVDADLPWSALAGTIDTVRPEHLETFRFVSRYQGKQLAGDKKSITFALTFRHPDRTLTHEEADAGQQQILSALQKEHGAILRS